MNWYLTNANPNVLHYPHPIFIAKDIKSDWMIIRCRYCSFRTSDSMVLAFSSDFNQILNLYLCKWVTFYEIVFAILICNAIYQLLKPQDGHCFSLYVVVITSLDFITKLVNILPHLQHTINASSSIITIYTLDISMYNLL